MTRSGRVSRHDPVAAVGVRDPTQPVGRGEERAGLVVGRFPFVSLAIIQHAAPIATQPTDPPAAPMVELIRSDERPGIKKAIEVDGRAVTVPFVHQEIAVQRLSLHPPELVPHRRETHRFTFHVHATVPRVDAKPRDHLGMFTDHVTHEADVSLLEVLRSIERDEDAAALGEPIPPKQFEN